jgi:hypothetical protein
VKTSSIATMAAIFAVPGTALAAQAPAIEKALARAAEVRAGNIQLPGNWTAGLMLPRQDGKMNFDGTAAVPTSGPRMLWIGGNGG